MAGVADIDSTFVFAMAQHTELDAAHLVVVEVEVPQPWELPHLEHDPGNCHCPGKTLTH